MYLTEDEKKLIEKFKSNIEALLGADKVKLILFGSKARGDSDRHSDIDIAIIVKKLTKKQKNLILEEIAEFEFENIMPISTLILSEEEFKLLKKRERAIAYEIENEGIRL
jgi:predicted nucleotidyltransferase